VTDRLCRHPGCDRTDHAARGLCRRCWQRVRKHGQLDQYPPIPTTPGGVLADVAARYGVPVAQILGPTSERQVVDARVAAAHGLRELGLSYPRIGKAVGGRHHSTVMHYLAKPVPAPPANPASLPDDGVCQVDGCDREDRGSLGLCSGHYVRWRRYGDIRPDRPLRPIRADDAPVLDLEVHDRTGYRNGCRCETCRRDAVRAVKLHRHRPALVDVAEAVAHLARLEAAGMCANQVAKAAGISVQPLYAWRDGRTTRGLRSNVDAVIAVEPPAPRCESCGEPSLAGGRWCWPCFRTHAPRAVAS
jgi:hypothetical protein